MTIGKSAAKVQGGILPLSAVPREILGILYVPAVELMTKVFGAQTVTVRNMTAVTFYDGLEFPIVLWRYFNSVVRGRACGEIHRSFWFEEGRRVIPYHMYIPTAYRPSAPAPACSMQSARPAALSTTTSMT